MPRYTSQNTYVIADVQVDPISAVGLIQGIHDRLSGPQLEKFLNDQIDEWVRDRISRRFAGEGDDVTGAWAPLLPATESIRASRGFPPAHPINQRTHMLRDWLVGTAGDVKVTGTGATYEHPGPTSGVMEQKLQTAQAGKGFPRTVPRPVLGLNEVDDLYIQFELTKFLLSGAITP